MGNRCVGGGDGRRECVVQRRAVAAVRGGVACRFLECLSPFESISFTLYASDEWSKEDSRKARPGLAALWLVLCWGDREG
jgi:hypothetical protein